MANIYFSFRIYPNKGNTKQVLKGCARLVNTSHYVPRIIASFGKGDLKEPDLTKWDAKKQRFKKNAPFADENNAILKAIALRCEQVITECNPQTIQSFWDIVCPKTDKGVTTDKATFGGFILSYIDDLRHGKTNLLPSKNYQIFITLYHHLQRYEQATRAHVLNVPTYQISNTEFKAFGAYLANKRQPNYNTIMAYFKRIHNVAIKKGLAKTPLTYDYKERTPRINKGYTKKPCLSEEEIKAFENLDLNTVFQSGNKPEFYKQLYKDTALLMYYLLTRPIDVLNLKTSDIKKIKGVDCVCYRPIKKKNTTADFTVMPITKAAQTIINRYKGQSKGGYLLPFAENEKSYNLDNATEYNKRYNRCRAMCEKIDTFLHKAGKALNFELDGNKNFTLYVLRHTAITLAMKKYKMSIIDVAQKAGTSIKQIENTYYDDTKANKEFAKLWA